MKKFLLLFCSIIMIMILLVPSASASNISEGTWGGIHWVLDSKGALVLTGSGNMPEVSDAGFKEIPWFNYRKEIITITIDNGITNIGDYAFWRSENLKSVSAPKSVTKVGRFSFLGCEKLSSINLSNSITELGPSAFDGCGSLTTIGTLVNVTTIGSHAFMECSSLTAIDLTNKVTEIPMYAFYKCKQLVSVGDLSLVTKIGENAFKECNSLEQINSLANVIEVGNEAFNYCTSLKSVGTVNPSAKIGKNVFNNCISLVNRSEIDPTAFDRNSVDSKYQNNLRHMGWVNIYPLSTETKSECGRLVSQICSGLSNDLDKAKACYGWITKNICYDYDKLNEGGIPAWEITESDKKKLLASYKKSDFFFDYSTEDLVIILGRGVCGDIAKLYSTMLCRAGIHARYESVDDDQNLGHAIVMAYLGGEWRYFDPTFDCNGRYSNKTYNLDFARESYEYFNMDLQRLSISHYFTEDVKEKPEDTPDEWCQDDIRAAQLLNIVPSQVCSDYRENITRLDFCRLVSRFLIAYKPEVYSSFKAETTPFEDVSKDHVTIVMMAYTAGVVKGTSESTFNPKECITRQDAAVMLYRLYKVTGKQDGNVSLNYADSQSISNYALTAVEKVTSLGLMQGSNGFFNPLDNITRQEAIMIMYRLTKV